MTDKLDRLIELLCEERGESVPALRDSEKWNFFRALVNVRMPIEASEEFLQIQDEYLQEELNRREITDISKLTPVSLSPDIYLWRGDITTLKCDGIVNAANSQMLGCFCPNHHCIDNAIHTFAGVQLRLQCAEIIKAQGHEEPTGQAKITKAYNLPCKYVLHTVGPIVGVPANVPVGGVIGGGLTERHEKLLESCYRSCLELADKHGLQSIAFCFISTGEFHFPNKRAAEIAVDTVREYKQQTRSKIKVIFNVFKECDYDIYSELLTADK